MTQSNLIDSRPTVLIFSRFYLPGHKGGGPIRSLSNIVERLSDDFRFKIVTSDRDLGDGTPYAGICAGVWTRVGRAEVLYMRSRLTCYRYITRLLKATRHELVYLNSFFDPVFSLLPLLATRLVADLSAPVLVAPRGEFSPRALHIRYWKKALYLQMVCRTGLLRDVVWHASTAQEIPQIRHALAERLGNSADWRILAASALTSSLPSPEPGVEVLPYQKEGKLRICFVSRIAPMKNLDFALRILGGVSVPVTYDIYGNIEDRSYWQHCQRLMRALPPNIEVRYLGPVDRASLARQLTRYNLFFLPTRGESFGHAIFEALQCGLPVLTSDQTPWTSLSISGAGWCFPLADPRAFVRVINDVAEWSAERRSTASTNARRLAVEYSENDAAVNEHRDMFGQLISRNRGKRSSVNTGE